MKEKDLKPNTLVKMKVTNNFETREAADEFHRQYPHLGEVFVGPPDHDKDEMLLLDEWKRFAIVKQIITRQ